LYSDSFIEKALTKVELGFEILTDVKIFHVFSKVQAIMAYTGRWIPHFLRKVMFIISRQKTPAF